MTDPWFWRGAGWAVLVAFAMLGMATFGFWLFTLLEWIRRACP